MPITGSGLWVPRLYPSKPRLWRRLWLSLAKNVGVIVSIAAISVSIFSIAVTVVSSVIAQRAYLSYNFELHDTKEALASFGPCPLLLTPSMPHPPPHKDWKYVILMFRLKITNFGNTPASSVYIKMKARSDWLTEGQEIAVQPILVDMAPKESISFDGIVPFKHPASPAKPPMYPCGAFTPMLTGTVEYSDAFGLPHADSLCYSIIVGLGSGISVSTCQKQAVPIQSILRYELSDH